MVSHGYKKGDKLLVQAGFGATVVTYLNYSEINWDCFICELENGDISDDWKWDEVIRKLDADEIKKHEELLGINPETKTEIIRCKDCKYVWKEDGWDNLYCNRVKVSGSFAVDKDGFCAWAKMEEGE